MAEPVFAHALPRVTHNGTGPGLNMNKIEIAGRADEENQEV